MQQEKLLGAAAPVCVSLPIPSGEREKWDYED
jgi:hypothetical protein